jgi:hypothetical protein
MRWHARAVWTAIFLSGSSLLIAPPAASAQPDEGYSWKFNFDATWGTFGFGNSLFNNPREHVEEDLSDQWFEGSMKATVSAMYTFASTSQLYATVGAVGERTYGSAPREFVGPDVSSFGPEDLSIGWRSGTSIGGSENLIDLTVGRAPFKIGRGMLIADGAAEGGSRGGYWSNARKAFELAAIARVSTGAHRIEAFYLDRDDLDERDFGTRVAGANYEFAPVEDSTVGASYLRVFTNRDEVSRRDGMDVFNLRAYTSPIPSLSALAFEAEYAAERNGDRAQATAWNAQAAYTFESTWSPRVSYRYALFSGDDPDTAANESFDPLMPGFDDWGTWWQGEIAGGYAIANSNLISHQLRLHVDPRDTLSGGLMVYRFFVDHPQTFEGGVTASDLATEADLYADWQIAERLTASFVLAVAAPHTAAEQAFGRTKSFRYGMVFLVFSY